MRNGFVYYAQSESGGPIKIGYASDVRQRIRDLKREHGALVLLAAESAESQQTETERHKRFASARSHGEWFRPTDELLMHIDMISVTPLSQREAGRMNPAHGTRGRQSRPCWTKPEIPNLDAVKRAHIERVIGIVDGHRGRACELLGIARPTLERNLRKYGLLDSEAA